MTPSFCMSRKEEGSEEKQLVVIVENSLSRRCSVAQEYLVAPVSPEAISFVGDVFAPGSYIDIDSLRWGVQHCLVDDEHKRFGRRQSRLRRDGPTTCRMTRLPNAFHWLVRRFCFGREPRTCHLESNPLNDRAWGRQRWNQRKMATS